jgi:hypothetical protein
MILHIGQAKTGTSAIQDHLARYRSPLREAGYLYPTVKVSGMSLDISNHNSLADSLVAPTIYPRIPMTEYFRQIDVQCKSSKSHTVILSGEHFFGGLPRLWQTGSEEEYYYLYEKKIRNFSLLAMAFDVHIIAYLRPQCAWLSSGINQNVKIGRLIDPGVMIYSSDRQFFEQGKSSLRYSRRLNLWNEIIRPKSFQVCPYIRAELEGQDSVFDFVKKSGLSDIIPEYPQSKTVNSSLTVEYVEVKKLLNLNRATKSVERLTIEILQKLSKSSKFDTTYMVDRDVVNDLLDWVDEDNRKISKLYFQSGAQLDAKSGYIDTQLRRPTPIDVQTGMRSFEIEFYSLRNRIRLLELSSKGFLRHNLPTLHAVMHNLKRRAIGYGAN